MTKVLYKSYTQNDYFLFPPCIGDFIPENHPVRTVNAILDNFDISEIESTYKGGGTTSYHPRMLLKIVVYAYLTNIYSGRCMASLLEENVFFMWLSGMSRPDFRTINRFRSERLADGRFESIFRQVVELLHEEGLISLDVQYIDGTKIESVANKYTFVWKGSVEKNKAKLIAKVDGVLKAAEAVLEEENADEPQEEITKEDLQKRTDRILEKMDKEGVSDKKLHKAVSKIKEDAMNNGQTKPGYNVQIATGNQYIVNYDLYWRPTDYGILIPFLESFYDKFGFYSSEIVADSGYGSEQNYEFMFANGMTPYVKYNMFHKEMKRKFLKNPFHQANMFYNQEQDFYVCPMGQHMEHVTDKKTVSDLGYVSHTSVYKAANCSGCPLRGICYNGKGDRKTIEVNHRANSFKSSAKALLTSDRGLIHRSKRPIESESCFGNIKFNHGFKRFHLKSTRKTKVEWDWCRWRIISESMSFIKQKSERNMLRA